MTGDEVKKENMVYGNLSDIQMADKVRMLYRTTLEHEVVCCGARDRIMYLSQQLEKEKAAKLRSAYKIIDLVLADVKIVFAEPVAKRNGPGFEAPKFAFIVKNMTETADKIKALLEQTDESI